MHRGTAPESDHTNGSAHFTVFDYARTLDGVFYYAMEYLEGISLERLGAEDGPQPPARVVHVLRQVSAALAEALRDPVRARGVPDVAKVLDFGLVKDLAVPEAAALTSPTSSSAPPSKSPPRRSSPPSG